MNFSKSTVNKRITHYFYQKLKLSIILILEIYSKFYKATM